MFNQIKTYSGEEYVRIASDFVLTQLCIIIALGAAVLYHTTANNTGMASTLVSGFPGYYLRIFLPLSIVFPLTFIASGFYSRNRTFTPRHKLMLTIRGAAFASVIFLAANYFLFPRDLVARSIAVIFCFLVIALIPLVRFVRMWLQGSGQSAETSAKPQNENNNIVLVVGGAGYIGSHLVRRLLETGRKVRVLDSVIYGYEAIKDILNHPNVELVVGDCRNIQSVVAAVKGVDTIIHLAAIVGDPACDFDKQTALEINYAATRMLIEVAKGNGVQRFVFASSCSVYGATDVIMDERSEVAPISLYAQTKIDSEEALLRAQSDTLHPTILRLATVFGLSHRPRFDLVVNLLTAKASQEKVITIFNGQQWRPFIHVRDIAEAILAVISAPRQLVSGQVFNVGDSTMNYTLTQVAEIIKKVYPDTRVEHIENSDRRNYRVSFDKIRNQLGFRCRLRVEDGVLELKKAFEEGAIQDYKEPYYSNQKFLQTSGSPANKDELDALVMAAFAGRVQPQTAELEGDLKMAAMSGR